MSKIIDIKVKNAVFVPVSNSLTGIKKMVYNSINSINFSLKDNMISWDDFLNKKQCLSGQEKTFRYQPDAVKLNLNA